MLQYKKINAAIILTSIALLLSCKKFVEIDPPKSQTVTEKVFKDSSNATAGVLGMYIYMMQAFSLNFASGGITVYTGLSSDELNYTSFNTDIKEFGQNNISPTNITNQSSLWANAYNIIYSANACIEGLSNNSFLTNTTRNQLLGESKFVRAFIYFNLANIYGDIPLITSTDYNENKLKPRSPVQSIYEQITNDLQEAQNLLSVNYITTGRVRPNNYTASALISKVYLYQKKWSEAESEASSIINSSIYVLQSDVNTVFKVANNNETIWQLMPVLSGIETWEGYFINPFSPFMIPNYLVTDQLLNSFESGDQRKSDWLKHNKVNGTDYFFPYKYKLGYTGNTSPEENYIVFRLAEQYLIRAEARAQQNKLSESIADVNTIRNRAGLPPLSSNINLNEILDAIEQEKKIEMFCEWGNRWFDLKRWDKASTILAPIKGNSWQPTDVLYPIPNVEIDRNPALVQNLGY